MIITSTSNEKIKYLRKIINEKGYLLLDSPKLIEEAIKSNYIIKYFIAEENKKKKFKEIFDYVNKCESEIIEVSAKVFKTLSNTIWSQGIIGVTEIKEREFAPPDSNYLVLDEVQDPGNVGTLIRSALGSGFKDVYLLNCASVSNEKVIRSTMGAIFKTRFYELSREDFLDKFKSFKNKNLLIADMKGINIFKTKIQTPCGVVIGNEGNGVSNEIISLAKETISIPISEEIESLNAGVAGSLIMLKIANQ
ncbi:MAG: RNA methyltransferase [Clostridia bacterium]|nr:RNA methyltransferase [Clostridia bacterium]